MTSTYKKLRRRIRDLVGLFLCVAVIALGYGIYRDYQQKNEELFKESQSHVRIIAEHASRTFGEADRVLDIVINKVLTPEKLRHITEKELYTAFLSVQKGIPQIVSVYFVKATGILFASSLDYPIKKINISDREFFQHHRDTPGDAPFISRPYKNRITNKWNFVFSQRISNPDGSFAGLIGASFEMSYFESLYGELLGTTFQSVSLVREDGFPIVMFPSEEKTFAVPVKNSSQIFGQLVHEPVAAFREYEGVNGGVDRIVAYCRLPANYPLVASVTYDWNNAIAAWKRDSLVKISLMILFGALAFLLSRMLVQRLTDLEQSEVQRSLLSQIVEQSPVSVVVTDPKGDISYVNACFTNLTGYNLEEAIGKNPRILKTELTSPETFRDMWSKLSSGQGWAGELCNKKKDGSLYWEMAHLFPVLDGDGAITHYAAVKEDITERKQFIEEVQRAKKVAEAANTAKSEFLANMSHEIRTPMNAITGMAYLTLQTDLDRRQRDYVGKILGASESLLGIINDILDFSKIEAGKMELEEVTFNLSGVLNQVSDIMSVRAQEKGLELVFSISPDAPGLLVGDPLRLRQVLNNLVGNSVKFTERGQVGITVNHARSTTPPGRVALTFTVTDTGIGMDDDQIGRIFAPFSQVDSSIARRYGGTGLGLSIVKSLVDLMGGALEVVSNPGKGSRFSFTIEFGLASQNAILAASQFSGVTVNTQQRTDLQRIKGARVLLVEDNPTNQQVAQEILHQAGMLVEVAASGRQALDACGNGRQFDLVFMDIQMPDLDGFEITRLIREMHPLVELPIVAMTAHAMAEDREKCLAVGMNDHVAKPINPNELKAALVRWIRPRAANVMDAQDAAVSEDFVFPAALHGVNVPVVLARIGGNGHLLRRLLVDFSEQYQQSVAEIRVALEAHELGQVRKLVHILKGVSGNLGFDSVLATVREIEKTLGNGHTDTLTALLDQLQLDLEDVFNAIQRIEKNWLGRKTGVLPDTGMVLEKDELQKQIKGLAVLLRGNKAAATKQFKELRHYLPESPLLFALEEQIDRLDFKKGLLSLQQLAHELQVSLEEQS